MVIAISILLHVTASIFLKLGATSLKVYTPLDILGNAYYLIALLAFGGQAITWQYALKRSGLGEAYMWTAAYYPLLLSASALIFAERITLPNILGTCIIITGILLLADSKKGAVK